LRELVGLITLQPVNVAKKSVLDVEMRLMAMSDVQMLVTENWNSGSKSREMLSTVPNVRVELKRFPGVII
jgi:hypothetical protein